MGPVLAFDTSAAHCAAALVLDDKIALSRKEDMARGQAERLMGLLDEVLEETGLQWSDLSALGVGIGPGNFTGIRISVAAARGLAMGLQIPAVGVSGLQALAWGSDAPTLASIDARRGSVYVQGFAADGTPLGDPVMGPADSVPLPVFSDTATCIGAEAAALAARLPGVTAEPAHTGAEAIALIAARQARPGLPAPAPLYLRPADAAPAKPAPALLRP